MSKSKTSPLVRTLFAEAFQTEQSAKTHCAREAKRLGAAPPGQAMKAVSSHAAKVLPKLDALARARDVGGHAPGRFVGRMFSMIRELTTDLFSNEEKSYRGTLLGMQHGKGVFLLLEDAAVASGDQDLADFCHAWLEQRAPMLNGAEQDMAWFAENPDVALSRAALLTAGQ